MAIVILGTTNAVDNPVLKSPHVIIQSIGTDAHAPRHNELVHFEVAQLGSVRNLAVPDARDDDIIARQLREAAMQEEDEELREKLWEEYRRYKKG